jgi:hypothetical protein
VNARRFGKISAMNTRSSASSDGYGQLLEALKERIRDARIKAALAVNRELVLLY